MSNAIWKLVVDPAVHKTLRKLPQSDREAIVRAIDTFVLDPHAGDVQKMKGKENAWRRRVRSYRIEYEIYPDIRKIFVYELKRRTSTTY